MTLTFQMLYGERVFWVDLYWIGVVERLFSISIDEGWRRMVM